MALYLSFVVSQKSSKTLKNTLVCNIVEQVLHFDPLSHNFCDKQDAHCDCHYTEVCPLKSEVCPTE